MTDEALQFLKAAFHECYDEEDDSDFEQRVIANHPFYHQDIPRWAYRPADDAIESCPEWDGGSQDWRAKYPAGSQKLV